MEPNTSTDTPVAPPKPRSWRWPRPGYLMSLGFVVAMACGIALDRMLWLIYMPPHAVGDFQLMAQAWNTIERFYVERATLKSKKLTYGAISGMVEALGDTGHSAFLSPDMAQQMHAASEGSLQGIGIEIQRKGRYVVVVAPLDDSPAQKAGLRSRDIILKVDSTDVTGMQLRQVMKRMAGPVGTSITLTILEARTGHTREVQVQRALTRIPPVTWRPLLGARVAHVRISSFSEGLTENLDQVLVQIGKMNLRGIILDVRNNPGGILDEAVGAASLFLRNGNVLLIKDADGEVHPVPVKKRSRVNMLPIVVLINGGSASSAEILAGALQDANRAVLVGENTFGTGTVLSEFPLTDGSILLLAIQEWLTPGGQSIWHKGITPKFAVALKPEASPLKPLMEREMTEAQIRSSEDEQLIKALELLAPK
jgi:carboxyl-terminal processing protease